MSRTTIRRKNTENSRTNYAYDKNFHLCPPFREIYLIMASLERKILISAGDSLEDVKKYYGNDYYKRREQGVEIIVFEDKKIFFEFWYWNNEVQEIRIGYNGFN